MSLRLCIEPSFDLDRTGGVARVVEAQRRFLPQFDIQLVDTPAQAHVYLGHAGNWTKRDDIPRVANVHGLYWTEPQYKWPKWATVRNAEIGRAIVEADMVISPAEWVADILRRDLWVPVNVVPNGIDPELIDSAVVAQASSYVLWNKARIDEVCEAESLIALATMAPSRQFIMHPKPQRRSLPPNLTAVGVVPYDKALEVMRNAGVYLATTREVHGVSVLEAMACGVPVLGYAWGGQREQMRRAMDVPFIGRYEEGFLVPPGNIGALRDSLELLSDPVVWKRASDAAKERSSAFNWQVIMEGLAGDLHQLWGGWNGHRPTYTPEISVVIPCYNMEHYLERCLSSVMLQYEAPSYEIIVVDDASTDGSYARACQLRDSIHEFMKQNGDLVDCRVVKHASNRYLAEALNTGIHEARGKWIVNLDPDNELPKHALRNLYRATQKHPDLDCVYGLMEILKPDGSLDTRWPNGVATYPPRTYDYWKQVQHENQVHSSAMFRRRMWERSGGYRQYAFGDGTRLNSDAEFWTRCGALGFRFGRVVDQPTLRYRLRADSMSHTVPEWDWTASSPKPPCVTIGAPGGNLYTHEPIQITIAVTGGDPAAIVESLWPQTFDRWEAIVVRAGYATGGSFMPPYVRHAESLAEAGKMARGRAQIIVDSDAVSRLEPDALQAFYEAHAEDPRGLYDVEDSALKGKIVMSCGGCGGGMRVTRRPGPPISSRTARSAAPTQMTIRQEPVNRRQQQLGISGRMTFVEFTGSGFRTRYMHRTDLRTKTRFQYIFGNEPDHRRVLVHVEDVAELTQNTQYREVPREELTEKELEMLDAVNAAADAMAAPEEYAPVTITISPATGRTRTFRGTEDPGDKEPEEAEATA